MHRPSKRSWASHPNTTWSSRSGFYSVCYLFVFFMSNIATKCPADTKRGIEFSDNSFHWGPSSCYMPTTCIISSQSSRSCEFSDNSFHWGPSSCYIPTMCIISSQSSRSCFPRDFPKISVRISCAPPSICPCRNMTWGSLRDHVTCFCSHSLRWPCKVKFIIDFAVVTSGFVGQWKWFGHLCAWAVGLFGCNNLFMQSLIWSKVLPCRRKEHKPHQVGGSSIALHCRPLLLVLVLWFISKRTPCHGSRAV
jgi:hypothetical protein